MCHDQQCISKYSCVWEPNQEKAIRFNRAKKRINVSFSSQPSFFESSQIDPCTYRPVYGERETDRQTDRQTDRDRERDRERQRETERDTDRDTDTDTDRQTETERHRQTDRQTVTERHGDREKESERARERERDVYMKDTGEGDL